MQARAHRSSLPTVHGLFAALLLVGGSAAAQPNVGLSTVRAQRFGNEDLSGFFTPQTGDQLGFSLAAGDFDGDGADDLATGMPYDDGPTESPVADSGSVVVRAGVRGSGLTTNLSSVYLRPLDVVEPGDRFGFSLAACDLNGDDYDDLAVGVPFEGYLGGETAGIVQVHYGSSAGLPVTGDTFFAQSTPGVPEDTEGQDWFGFSLACGDFDGDTFDDLAVGAPQEDWWFPSGYAGKGWVVVVPGSPSGLAFGGSWAVSQDSEGMPDQAEGVDDFGWALAADDFDGDGYDDLVIGVVGEDDQRGAIHLLFGGPSGLRTDGSLFLDETAAGGNSEVPDQFGEELASGDIDGDGFADLVLGMPNERAGGADFAGQVMVLFGAVGGFDLTRTQAMTEEFLFGAGTSEPLDYFGGAVAVADIDADGHDDVVAGHYGEALSGPNDGAATVVMGSPDGLDLARARTFTSLVGGVGGGPGQAGERFSWSLAAGDFDGDGHGDVAIGAPTEDENGVADVGAETVLYGALFADGVESGNTALWPQTLFVPGNNEIAVTTAARLGTSISRRGIELRLIDPDFRRPSFAAFVRVGPEGGFRDERSLAGQFFIDPQNLTMSTTPGANGFQMMAFSDGLGSGARVVLLFNLVRNPADGDWLLNVQHFNEELGTFQFSGGGVFALDGTPAFANNRIEFVWEAGSPGRLTMWRTRFLDGAPEATGRVQMFAAALPGMGGAVINHAFVGLFGSHDPGTFGTLRLDEIAFRRAGQIGSTPDPRR